MHLLESLVHVMLSNRNNINHDNNNNKMTTMNNTTMAPTVPETLGVSNVAQEKNSKLNEKTICGTYSCGPRSMSHPQHVTRNMDSQLNQPTVSSTGDNVALMQTPTRKNRRISFSHESATTVLYSETKNTPNTSRWNRCKDLMHFFISADPHHSQRQQWKDFMLLLMDPTRNLGIRKWSIRTLLAICNECRDAGLEFSFEAIEGHDRFGQEISRLALANLFNEAGHNVSVSCPLEQPGGGYSYQGNNAVAAPASLQHETIYTRGMTPVSNEVLQFGNNWEVFYGLCSGVVSEEQLDELSDIESDYTARHGLVDCNREYVQQFCDQAKWPRELIDIMLDLYYAHQAPEDGGDDTEFLDDPIADDDTIETVDQLVPETVPDDVTFESLAADSESLNSAGGTFKFCAAVRLLHQNSLCRRVACPESSPVKPKTVVTIDDDTIPLGFEWHLDDKGRRVRRSLRIQYKKQRAAAVNN
jgi:hypothetical protein